MELCAPFRVTAIEDAVFAKQRIKDLREYLPQKERHLVLV